MKYVATIFCAALLALVPAQASDRQLDPATLEALMEHAAESKARLGLSAEQEAAVAPILARSREQRLGILERYGFGNGQKPSLRLREKLSLAKEMKAVRQETEQALAHHLTREQMDTYRDLQEERRERMKAYMKDRKG